MNSEEIRKLIEQKKADLARFEYPEEESEVVMRKFEVYYTSGNYESETLQGESTQEVEADVINFHMDDIEELFGGDIEAWKKETGLSIIEV